MIPNAFCVWAVSVIFLLAVKAWVYFKDGSLTASNEEYMTDEEFDSCAAFNQPIRSSTPKYSQFSIGIPYTGVTDIDVDLEGWNLGCGSSLFVTASPVTDPTKWTGRWNQCSPLQVLVDDDKESCSFRCSSSESYQAIQVLKRPLTIQQSSWTMCNINFSFAGCETAPNKHSGVYPVKVTSDENVSTFVHLYCDMITDGGGWTVLLRRMDGSVDFERRWEDYKLGFGSVNGEFWAGNELIHRLTSDGRTYSVRFDFEAYNGDKIYAIYNDFSVGPESDNYILHVSHFNTTSTAGDSFTDNDGMMFSTAERDNDKAPYNCAELPSPWWNNACSFSFPTGRYGPYPNVTSGMGIKWYYHWGDEKFAKYATMMLRPN